MKCTRQHSRQQYEADHKLLVATKRADIVQMRIEIHISRCPRPASAVLLIFVICERRKVFRDTKTENHTANDSLNNRINTNGFDCHS